MNIASNNWDIRFDNSEIGLRAQAVEWDPIYGQPVQVDFALHQDVEDFLAKVVATDYKYAEFELFNDTGASVWKQRSKLELDRTVIVTGNGAPVLRVRWLRWAEDN